MSQVYFLIWSNNIVVVLMQCIKSKRPQCKHNYTRKTCSFYGKSTTKIINMLQYSSGEINRLKFIQAF